MLVGCRRVAGPEQAGSRLWRRADRQRVHGQRSRERLRALGVRPRKGLSQAFLDDAKIAAAIVRVADLDPEHDDVLEVGPGLGALTERLVRAARRVVAIEIDALLADALRSQFDTDQLTVETADILELEPARYFDAPFVVVANLPYHITSPALRHLLAAGPPFARRFVVMTQAEVAERITAVPGSLSALGVTIQAQATVRLVRRVPRTAFHPQPKVDSAVLVIEPLVDRSIERTEVVDFTAFVQAGFKQPRKQLGNSLADGLGAEKSVAIRLLEEAGVQPTRRPQELRVEEWVRLFRTPRAA